MNWFDFFNSVQNRNFYFRGLRPNVPPILLRLQNLQLNGHRLSVSAIKSQLQLSDIILQFSPILSVNLEFASWKANRSLELYEEYSICPVHDEEEALHGKMTWLPDQERKKGYVIPCFKWLHDCFPRKKCHSVIIESKNKKKIVVLFPSQTLSRSTAINWVEEMWSDVVHRSETKKKKPMVMYYNEQRLQGHFYTFPCLPFQLSNSSLILRPGHIVLYFRVVKEKSSPDLD